MKIPGMLILVAILFAGCDPVYHNYYVVHNKSHDTLLVASLQHADTVLWFTLFPGMNDTVLKESGVGYSKPVFDRENSKIRNGLSFYSPLSSIDSGRNMDSLWFSPAGKWEYSETNRCEGTALMIITSTDLKK